MFSFNRFKIILRTINNHNYKRKKSILRDKLDNSTILIRKR